MGWVWFGLVVTTLGVIAWFARDLWRRVLGLLRQVGQAGAAMSRLDRKETPWRSSGASMYDDEIELRARVARLRARRDMRRTARARRHHQTWARWDGVE